MVTVQLCYGADGEFTAVVSTDADPHPDLLDEMTTRCQRLFLDTQAALPDGPPDDEAT